jgi:formamidopyrimidine-DNA glycosylase
MPELPEVESLRKSLIPFLVNQTVLHVEVKRSKLVSGRGTKRQEDSAKAKEFETQITGEVFESVERRAKNLIIKFKSGKILLVHLKMTGQLVFKSKKNETILGGHPIEESESQLPNKHTYIIFELSNGTLYYNDVRMFGYVLYYPNYEIILQEGHFADLGLEPLSEDFTQDYFVQKMSKKSGVLKKVLMDQQIVVGLGNIYCDEVCFAAGVRPDRRVNSLTEKELIRLFVATKDIIKRAVDAGGSSVANYLMADGKRGNYAHEHKVYLKGGKPCSVCGEILQKCVINSRTTVYCVNCQK